MLSREDKKFLANRTIRKKRTLRGSFRTRADSVTGNKARLSGGRKKFNVNFIVKTGGVLYN